MQRPKRLRYLGAAALIAVATVGWFHNVAAHPGSRLAGNLPSDATSGLRDEWATALQHRNPLTFRHDALEGAPEGLDRTPAVVIGGAPVETAFVWGLIGALGRVGAWNLFAFAGFVLTGVSMFVLLDVLGCGFGPAFFGAYVFTFNPNMFERTYAGHLALVQNWVYPLTVAAVLVARRRRSFVAALGVGAAIAVSYYDFSYNGLFSAVLVAVFGLVELARLPDRRERWRTVALTGSAYLAACVLLLPVLVVYARDHAAVTSTTGHGTSDFYTFAGSPGAYLVPSPRNPLFHWLRGVHPADLVEKSLFFGYTTLLLALLAAVGLRRRERWLVASDGRRWTAVFLVALAVAGFVLSLPPSYHVGGIAIPMPSLVLAIFTTFWRDYARFGVLVTFAGAGLAAFALAAWTQRSPRLARVGVPLLLALVAFVELVPGNIHAFDTTRREPWSTWLSRQPDGIVAAYPEGSGNNPGAILSRQDIWYQQFDGHPRFEVPSVSYSAATGRDQAIRLLAADLADPMTARVLATEHVRYVILHPEVYRQEGRRAPRLDPRHYSLLRRFGEVGIYRVHATPVRLAGVFRSHAAILGREMGLAKPRVAFGSGFDPAPEAWPPGSKTLAGRGRLKVDAPVGLNVILSVVGSPRGHGMRLAVADTNGRPLTAAVDVGRGVRVQLGPFRVPLGASTLILAVTRSAGGRTGGSVVLSHLALLPVPDFIGAP